MPALPRYIRVVIEQRAAERTIAEHRNLWGEPDLLVRSPGRVNLIGEHTDYNDGFTLPMALPFDTVVALSSIGDPVSGTVNVVSEGFGSVAIDPAADPQDVEGWAIHVAGVIRLLGESGVPTGGWRATLATDIPTGASLSSSAAIEVAIIIALLARAGTTWEAIDVARLGQRVENEVVGLPSGIMDQFISAGAIAGHASMMDCRALTLSPAPLPAGVAVTIMDTGTRRVLAEVAYGDRRAACERAVAELGIVALRDASLAQVAKLSDPIDRRRAHHVVTENQRTVDAVAAMAADDAAELGRLMSESHISLRDDFEVSGPGLDAIVEVALASPGCLGARMTGGGFAGCAVALVDIEATEAFEQSVLDNYHYAGNAARVWICEPSAGAAVIGRALWPS
jgi:galactokinase